MAVQTAPFIAIIVTPKRITIAEARFIDAKLQVMSLGDIEPPAGSLDGNQLAGGESLGKAIGQFLGKHQIGARQAVIVLPEGTTITQLIKLPNMPQEDMLGAVRAVAERYALFAEHAINVSCATVEELDEDGRDMAQVLMSASREANVQQCHECARAAGLELLSIESAAVTTANAYRERIGKSEVVALSVVGEMKTEVMIFDRGVLKLCYSANAGLPQQTEAGDWMTPPKEGDDPFVPPPQLYSELNHCFRFYQNQFPRSAVQRVLLAADHPQGEVVASHLAEQLQLPVELGRPGDSLELPRGVDAGAAATTRSLTLALIMGSALSALRESELTFAINLIPSTMTYWRPIRPYIKAGVAVVMVLVLGTLVWGWSLGNKIQSRERELEIQQAELEALQPELEALRAARATELALYSEVERQTARIARERSVRWSQILVDVSDRLPRDMWLLRLASPDSNRITLTGIATNRETIPNAIESLGSSPYLENVRLGSLTSDDVYAPGMVVIRYQVNGALLRGIQPPLAGPQATATRVEEGGAQ